MRGVMMSLPVLALALAAFGIGSAELVIPGLLPEISAAFNVSIPTAGLLVTGYALGVAIGGPLMVILLNRLGRRAALLALMGLFTIGNVLCAVAPSFSLLMAARIITSLCHGSFLGIALVVAAGDVPRASRPRQFQVQATSVVDLVDESRKVGGDISKIS
jgi:DHA1 family inner membrane transport protein